MKRKCGVGARGLVGVVFSVVVALWAAAAQGRPVITCNNAAEFGGGPINTYDFTGGAIVGSFVPTGAFDNNNGRGIEIIGNKVYYTELTDESGPSDFIRIAPLNRRAPDARHLTPPHPSPPPRLPAPSAS